VAAAQLPPPAREAAVLTREQQRHLDALTLGAVVADDANRIIYLNAAAETAIGWSAVDLVGQRLVTIVPTELRVAHLAGFGRYLITAEPRLISRPVTVPQRRHPDRHQSRADRARPRDTCTAFLATITRPNPDTLGARVTSRQSAPTHPYRSLSMLDFRS
jgi:PAS domain S-box-containing protein